MIEPFVYELIWHIRSTPAIKHTGRVVAEDEWSAIPRLIMLLLESELIDVNGLEKIGDIKIYSIRRIDSPSADTSNAFPLFN